MRFHLPLFLLTTLACSQAADPAARASNTIILDETAVKNLRIETAVAEETTFEETVFALGRIDVLPGRRAVVSSRITGRALEVLLKPDHAVEKGAAALVVESRQPGNPPPSVTLAAPLTGLVSRLEVVTGEPVEPGEALAEIVDLTDVYARARVPDHLAGELRAGQPARITVPAVPGRTFEATLEHFGAEADAETGTIEAAFRVANPDLILRPGMRAEFSIVTGRRENVFAIPQSAVQGDASNRFVFVKDFELPNAFLRTPVVTGKTNDRLVEIVSGLFPADEVVVTGAYPLSFVGGSTLSLKEALDAAHGHEHAADGSELTDAEKNAPAPASPEAGSQSPFWMIVSGILFAALVVVGLKKTGSRHAQ